MKIYLASTAPGNEKIRKKGMLDIYNRLLSYYLIKNNNFEDKFVFLTIKKEKEKNENLFGR